LLRLLLPLNDQVRKRSSQQGAIAGSPSYCPKSSLSHSIGSSDGRCVQRFLRSAFAKGLDYILSTERVQHPPTFSL